MICLMNCYCYCKKLSKYVTTFNYIDKIFIILNATKGGDCIISHATLAVAPVRIASAGRCMKGVGNGIGVKTISELVLKEIYHICETKNLTKEQINEYKITEREIHDKFGNLVKMN